MKKLLSIFKKFYLVLFLLMVLVSFGLGSFLRKYLYDTLYNSQIIVVLKQNVSLPNIMEFENLEAEMQERNSPNEIAWQELYNPFK